MMVVLANGNKNNLHKNRISSNIFHLSIRSIVKRGTYTVPQPHSEDYNDDGS